ncbi:MAG TPA: sugar transferase [Solirubrobacteraceae bacterium]|nr:sugar transferase [Solirubrobacteraceae bacterium]
MLDENGGPTAGRRPTAHEIVAAAVSYDSPKESSPEHQQMSTESESGSADPRPRRETPVFRVGASPWARRLGRVTRRQVERPISEAKSRRGIARRDAVFRRCLAVADVAAAGAALLLCIGVLGDDRLHLVTLFALPLVVVAGKISGLYDRDELLINKTTLDQAPQLFQLATLYALLIWLLDQSLIVGELGSRQVLVLWGSLFVFVVLGRRAARWVARRVSEPERCLFVGGEDSHNRLSSKLDAHQDGRAILVGRMVLTPDATAEPLVDTAPTTLARLIDDLNVHRVIVEPSEAAPQLTLDFVREAKAMGIRVSLLPRILEVVGSSIEVDDLNGLTLLGVRRFGLTRSSQAVKRTFDICGAGVGLLVISPMLAAVALIIKLDSPGPVFFRQTRVGRDGKAFQIWKFRTMVQGADNAKADILDLNEAEGLFKIARDPRVTRVGRRLRAWSLDELPQLVNVLRGEMSLVGPRPLILDEDAKIIGLDRRRLYLTPGMTGHWQILGSARIPLTEMVKLDYLYVAGWSLWEDIKILLRTIPYMLARRGV